MKKKIEKQWCTFGSMWPIGFGKIMEEQVRCVFIRYYHDQLYENSCWDKNYVKRFDTLEEAAKHFQEYCGYYLSDWKLEEKILDAFPKDYKKGKKKCQKK